MLQTIKNQFYFILECLFGIKIFQDKWGSSMCEKVPTFLGHFAMTHFWIIMGHMYHYSLIVVHKFQHFKNCTRMCDVMLIEPFCNKDCLKNDDLFHA